MVVYCRMMMVDCRRPRQTAYLSKTPCCLPPEINLFPSLNLLEYSYYLFWREPQCTLSFCWMRCLARVKFYIRWSARYVASMKSITVILLPRSSLAEGARDAILFRSLIFKSNHKKLQFLLKTG